MADGTPASTLQLIGAGCFGAILGWYLYYINRYRSGPVDFGDIITILGAIGGVMVASFVLLSSFTLMCAAVFVAGATLASISPVSLALQGVVTPRQDLGRANAFYNAAYAAGMLLGPSVSSVLFTKLGGGAMLFHLAALWAAFVTFTVVFAADDPRFRARREARDATLVA